MLVLSGDRAFPPWPEADVERLRRWVVYGGFLLVDDASDEGDDAFGASVRRELGRILPGSPITPVGDDHVLYRTFLPARWARGTARSPDAVDGVERDGRLAVVVARQDLAGLGARQLRNWEHEVVAGASPSASARSGSA